MAKEYDDFLIHYGIKGQKWGVRRFQNEDGTLIKPKKKRKAESDSWKHDNPKYLSDEELNRRNSRMQREMQYKQNIRAREHPFRKELRETAKKIFVSTAVASIASIATLHYRTHFNNIVDFAKKVRANNVTINKI